MTAFYLIGFLLLTVGTVFILHLTPNQINEDVSVLFNKKQSLRDKVLTVRGKKKKNRLLRELEKIKRALEETGKEKQFSFACAAALLLVVAGAVAAIAIDNPFLIPVLRQSYTPRNRNIDFALIRKNSGFTVLMKPPQ